MLLDLSMPRLNGVETLQLIRQGWPDQKVLIVTSYVDDYWVVPALRAGANGYILKTAPSDSIIRNIKATILGDAPVSGDVVQALAQSHPMAVGEQHVHLSPRELQTVDGLARGLSNDELANEQLVSLSTIKQTLKKLTAQLGANNRAHIVARAVALGAYTPPGTA